jgi:hypothetical protein
LDDAKAGKLRGSKTRCGLRPCGFWAVYGKYFNASYRSPGNSGTCIDQQHVLAITACYRIKHHSTKHNGVFAKASDNTVIAVASIQSVRARTTDQRIGTRITQETVISAAAIQPVIAIVTGKTVAPLAAKHTIIPISASEGIITAKTFKQVSARLPIQPIGKAIAA